MQSPDTKRAVKVKRFDTQSAGIRWFENWLERHFYLVLSVIILTVIGFCLAGLHLI
jgi:hypothetical protein